MLLHIVSAASFLHYLGEAAQAPSALLMQEDGQVFLPDGGETDAKLITRKSAARQPTNAIGDKRGASSSVGVNHEETDAESTVTESQATGPTEAADGIGSEASNANVNAEASDSPALADAEGKALSGSVCGEGEEVDDTSCLAEDSLQMSQAQATTYMAGIRCTAWLVKAATARQGALMLTTGHCGESKRTGRRNTNDTFYFNYVQPRCGGSTPRGRLRRAAGKCTGTLRSLEAEEDEQGIYELDPCPYANAVTPILLDVGRPYTGEQMYIIGHPNGRPQLISYEEQHDKGNHCVVTDQWTRRTRGGRRSNSRRVGYYCDTQGGNSGSPVFSSRTGRAFAIHSNGGCNARSSSRNWGSLLENIKDHLDEFGIPYVNRSVMQIFPHQLKSRKNSFCLNYETSNRNVNMFSCAPRDSQMWYFDGQYLKNMLDSQCLDYEPSGNVVVSECSRMDKSHRWFFNGKQVKSKGSKARCLTADNQNVVMARCDNPGSQQWYFAQATSGVAAAVATEANETVASTSSNGDSSA